MHLVVMPLSLGSVAIMVYEHAQAVSFAIFNEANVDFAFGGDLSIYKFQALRLGLLYQFLIAWIFPVKDAYIIIYCASFLILVLILRHILN